MDNIMENNNNQDFNLSQAFRDIRADADSILYTSNKRQATEFACAAQIIALSDEEYKLLPQNLRSFCDKGLNEIKTNLQIISKKKSYINKVQPTDNIYLDSFFTCPKTTCFKKYFADAAYEGLFSNRVEAIYHHFKIEMKQAMIDTLQEEINVLECLCDEILATIFTGLDKLSTKFGEDIPVERLTKYLSKKYNLLKVNDALTNINNDPSPTMENCTNSMKTDEANTLESRLATLEKLLIKKPKNKHRKKQEKKSISENSDEDSIVSNSSEKSFNSKSSHKSSKSNQSTRSTSSRRYHNQHHTRTKQGYLHCNRCGRNNHQTRDCRVDKSRLSCSICKNTGSHCTNACFHKQKNERGLPTKEKASV